MKTKYKESDLYLPIKKYFSDELYKVNSEVRDIDVTALKGDELIAIELKLNFNISLVFQAMERQKITNQVYVCTPKLKGRKGFKTMQKMTKLCNRLCVGLIVVDLSNNEIDIKCLPKINNDIIINKKERDKVINEIQNRSLDLNLGGMNKTKIVTAYRERALYIAAILEVTNECSAKILREKFNCDEKTYSILTTNVYGFFAKSDKRGYYKLSDKWEVVKLDDLNVKLLEVCNEKVKTFL